MKSFRISAAPFLALACCILFAAAPAHAGLLFRLTASDVVIEQPSPLFSSASVSGTLTLADTVVPGASFGSSAVTGLTLNFGGIMGTFADVQADIAPGPVQLFGTRSNDGQTFSVFDLRFGFPPGVTGCSFVCAGQIIINSPIGPNDPSNFIAIDDLAGDTLSIIDSFTPKFTLVPEPGSIILLGSVLAGWAATRRRRGQTPLFSM